MTGKILAVLCSLLVLGCAKQKSDKPPAPPVTPGDRTEFGCAVAIQPTAAAGDAGVPTFEGTAKSDTEEGAHMAAQAAACAKAGAGPHCVEDGQFVRTGGSTSREVVHGQ